MSNRMIAAAILAGAALVPTAAAAQETKPTQAQYAATARYALPLAMQGTIDFCRPHLQSNGFFATNGSSLVKRYTAGKDKSWPVARDTLVKVITSKDKSSAAFITALPDEALKSMADAFIPTLVVEELNPKDCLIAEKIVAQLAPLPAENVANLFGVVITAIDKDEARKAAQTKATSPKAAGTK
ncbi:hypothetical protein HME9302_01177 [Alteripontixanthobacter maritimus]|uniref:Uncharacterized protein n=1 Tax=Alteripontixanthobacter maritimus TaxID=2161824 RepID=A0A369QAN5_9SPHN|nr:hypothetical protein [Alteripontixanthobacter maritimus]RDC59979.1 hypothetical protein HME9302_01177 [Alteripontixanthobacter maritimus]